MEPIKMSHFESFAERLIGEHQIPGVSIGLSQNGESVYYKGFGHRDVEKNLPVNPETVFGIASITKSFTCVAIMQLQEAGKLSVHDRVVKHLPDFSTPDPIMTEQMTIHHFMTNTSGLPPLPSLVYANKRTMDADPSIKDYPGLDIGEDPEQAPLDTYEDLISFIGRLEFELLGPPGLHFSYSNDAFALLGAIIEKVSGQAYEQYIKEQILLPAGMKDSTFDLDELDSNDVTMLYAKKENEDGTATIYPAPVWWDAPSMRPAGYLKSSVRDMLRYTEIFRNKGVVHGTRILSEDSVRQMTYPYIEIEPGKYYGYGLMITPDYYGHTLVEHGGNLKAIASLMAVVPEIGLSGVILTNLAGVPATTILMGALNEYQEYDAEHPHIRHEAIPITPDELNQYTGAYASNEGMSFTISVENDEPAFYTSGSEFPIHYIGHDRFQVEIEDQKEILTFKKNHQGLVDRVSYHYRQFPKVEKSKVEVK